jgi:hypothetical protein
MKLTGDLSAKLLATENITVVRSRVRTASFDIKSRVLTLPNWKDMTPEIDDMLRGHEVGHALFTDESYIEPIMENRKIASYLNVIEDVRIEKLLKRKYPGIRKSMNEGYRQLNEKDFFGVSKIPNLEVLNLIDRINLYYKAGYSCGVTFSSEEKLFVARAEKTETVDEVIALANDIYAFSKEQAEKRRKEAQENPEDLELSEEDDDDADGDDDGCFACGASGDLSVCGGGAVDDAGDDDVTTAVSVIGTAGLTRLALGDTLIMLTTGSTTPGGGRALGADVGP